MRKTLLFLFVLVLVAGVMNSCRKNVLNPPVSGAPIPGDSQPPGDDPAIEETEPAILTAVTRNISPNIQGFYQALPAHYNETDQKYPVIISFHGGGQYGNGSTDLALILNEGIPKRLSEKTFPPSFTVGQKKYSFVVVAPQLVKAVDNSEVETFVKFVKDRFRIDPTRIYMTGLSLGARQLSNYAAYKPSGIAAVATMGGAPQIDENLAEKCASIVSADLPIWQFHNRDDSAWYYSESKRYVEVLNENDPSIPPVFTSFNVGQGRLHHDCWTRGTNPDFKVNGKNIYEWMLGYTRLNNE
jgi:predicted peptidase